MIEKLTSSSELTMTVARAGLVALKVMPAPPLAWVSASLVMALASETLNDPVGLVPDCLRTLTPVAASRPTPSERSLS